MSALRYLIIFLSLTFAVSADQAQSGFKYGERPTNSVFDPTGILTVKEADEIATPLVEILKNEEIDVIVVVLPEIGTAPPLHVARGFAEKWSQTEINAVVLHIPGQEDSPWIFPGKVMSSTLPPDVMRQSLEEAESRARAEPSEFSKIKAASIEAADVMRFWKGSEVIRDEVKISRQLQARLIFEQRDRLIKLSLGIGAAALIPLIFGAVFFFVRIKSSGAKRFPDLRVTHRLGAPYSGGNNAVSGS
ncbi:MAG: TPM domain-containing protein [Akkermansiaceae bacterium]|jgi:hypothetical protein|nr:TPM domain-containing protein [Akkermansiaceae bacterium]MDP4722258.1 TPM domain-containing protein [Akkermansiaceae bacterium]MDP4780299.1 TPM domain-containing protein [Akkermansiaceae bacterium]MDP4846218.1 TPM domain-containing protein [Akkermansiaceae bacterium]MDP4898387.1 TPM domain-containing protein [Akkermansiaceae bacterium]